MAVLSIQGQTLTLENGVESYLAGLDGSNWDSHPLILLADKIEPGSVYLDVGANIGCTALLVSLIRPDITVYAFEPVPSNATNFLKNMELNGIKNCILIHSAVGDSIGTVEIDDNGPWSVVGQGNVKTPVTTLDSFLQKTPSIKNIGLIKIDVEGFEPNVLDGAAKLLSTYKNDIFMEYNSWTLILQNVNPISFAQRLIEQFEVYTDKGIRQTDAHAMAHEHQIHNTFMDVILKHKEKLPNTAGRMTFLQRIKAMLFGGSGKKKTSSQFRSN